MTDDTTLPGKLDSETRCQLRRFLRPLLDAAPDWPGLARTLAARGYTLGFRDGRLLVIDAMSGRPICTGSDLDRPLAALARRLGRPRLRATADGHSAALAAR
ncbi:hypothetical protein ROJ8625_00886 [Roseivivax jejudonensis]|uniref:Uncharacterized protein n=1 Tax=Roseivivax jejudonensis TaxID=1529041 RepID=A0A1X6YJI9_9RHOB|nr:hypothetical protein [Roseivivax jejudonensis]SLN22663.1 hypothetical protein ROJ8625_00886 [Roseivivax jejudonensis]